MPDQAPKKPIEKEPDKKELKEKEKQKINMNVMMKTIVNKNNPEIEKPHVTIPDKPVIIQPAGSNFR